MIAIVVVSASGVGTARRVAVGLKAPLHGRPDGTDVPVENFGDHLRGLFIKGTPIVFIGALGALVRLLAPVIGNKIEDPPVVVVAEDGSAVIPVLGGHHGANDLARRVAALLDVAPAITTASDLRFGVALDEPPRGWHLANTASSYKEFMTRLLAQSTTRVEGDLPWLTRSTLPISEDAALLIHATEHDGVVATETLVYHPECLVLGVGCERDVDPQELITLARQTLADAGLSAQSVAAVVSVDVKMDEAAVHALAKDIGRPARFFTAAALEAETPRLANPSEIVFREVGCHGVAEAAALATVGPAGELLVEKQRSKRATCAIAKAPGIIDASVAGMPRGRLFVIGTGPGTPDWRTPEVERMVGAASDLVGYGLYLDLLGPLAAGKVRHEYRLGEERDRVFAALDLAAEGRTVALVSSGDPGIYAMASLVFECLDELNRPDWQRLEIVVSPGISALQACAARIGAPLGHDFCTISLSDLLTPWEAIERRLQAAAEGDFVVALYNPASGRRRSQLVRALKILGTYRPGSTPVILGRALGRPEESVSVTPLAAFDPETVDMLSLVMIGSSQTRVSGNRVFTPRGYVVATAEPKALPS
jgi:cobalt-precorrin 5A hydrolase/precorrin-3B C17-methyltransferase